MTMLAAAGVVALLLTELVVRLTRATIRQGWIAPDQGPAPGPVPVEARPAPAATYTRTLSESWSGSSDLPAGPTAVVRTVRPAIDGGADHGPH